MTPPLSAATAVTSPFVWPHRLGFYFYSFLVMVATTSRGASLPLTEKEAGVSGGGSLVLYFGFLKEDANLNPPQMHTDQKQTKTVCLSRPSQQIKTNKYKQNDRTETEHNHAPLKFPPKLFRGNYSCLHRSLHASLMHRVTAWMCLHARLSSCILGRRGN